MVVGNRLFQLCCSAYLLSAPLLCCWASLCLALHLFILFVFGVSYPLCHHNFQHWMSWLGWWWRVQQSVISMLNSRISWINRDLNAHCAFGVFLKACLLQRLLSIISKLPWLSHAWLLHALCVRGAFCLWHMQLIACLPVKFTCDWGFICLVALWLTGLWQARHLKASFAVIFRNMNLGQQARWI